MVEPGRAGRRDLRLKIEIGARREYERRASIFGASEATNLDDAAIDWSELEGVRNIRPGFAKIGLWGGLAYAAIDPRLRRRE